MAKPKFRTRCPCCGQQLEKPIALGDASMVRLSCNEQSLFNLVKSNPVGLTVSQIRERIFPEKQNGDEYSSGHRIVSTTAYHTNKKIAAWGMKIINTGGPGSTYYLVAL